MNELLEILVSFVSIVATVIAGVRLLILVSHRSMLEVILASNSTRAWEEFVEILLVIFFLMISLTFPIVWLDLVMSNIVLDILALVDFAAFFISLFVLAAYAIVHFFSHKIRKFIKVVNVAIFVNMISLFVSVSFMTIAFKTEIMQKIKSHAFVELICICLSAFVCLVVLVYLYRNLFVYFNGRKQTAYKVEICDISVLNDLYFIFALDADRSVFANYPVNREKLSLPAYLYYPREKMLYKYFKDESRRV